MASLKFIIFIGRLTRHVFLKYFSIKHFKHKLEIYMQKYLLNNVSSGLKLN